METLLSLVWLPYVSTIKANNEISSWESVYGLVKEFNMAISYNSVCF